MKLIFFGTEKADAACEVAAQPSCYQTKILDNPVIEWASGDLNSMYDQHHVTPECYQERFLRHCIVVCSQSAAHDP